jgi:hypothetical protein
MKKLVIIAALMCSGAHAQFKSGNELRLDYGSSNAIDRGISLGFVMGVADAGNGFLFCMPSLQGGRRVHYRTGEVMA